MIRRPGGQPGPATWALAPRLPGSTRDRVRRRLSAAYDPALVLAIWLPCLAAALNTAADAARARGFGPPWLGPGELLMLAPLLIWGMFAVGGVRGPVIGSPFVVHALAQTGPGWRRAIPRRFALAAITLVGLGVSLWALAAVSVQGPADPADPAAWVFGGSAAVGVTWLGAVAWLAGQVWQRAARLAGALAVVGVALWSALGWPAPPTGAALGAPGSLGALGALGALSLVALVFAIRLTAKVGPNEVVGQSLVWESAQIAVRGQAAHDAAAAFRPNPIRPRTALPAAGRSWPLTLIGWDFAALARSPARSLTALAGLVWAGCLTARTLPGSPPLPLGAGPLGAAAGLIGFAALGGFWDGLRDW
ncbi:MAG: hypothetical protein LBE08_13895, partial [Bifidobacteriaceae bacterium]|nr:hypothetical protein [Bifidobacteriaceae bacterium]